MSTQKSSNVRRSHKFFSAIELLVVLFILGSGLLLMGVHYSPILRNGAIRLLIEQQWFLLSVGELLVILSLFLFVGFYFMNRRRFLSFQVGSSKASINESIVSDYVTSYWKENFPEVKALPEVCFRGGKELEVIAHVPEGDQLLERVESELSVVLARKVGYEKPFTLTIVEGSPHREKTAPPQPQVQGV